MFIHVLDIGLFCGQTHKPTHMQKALLFSVLSLMFIGVQAQTLHEIEAGGGPGGPDPYYDPQFITIQVGDTVRWTNTGGMHNVDGSLSAYPDNPEGFFSGDPSSSMWVFEYVFTLPGVYGFECSAFDHADTQFGTVTVEDGGTHIEEFTSTFDIYPNPSTDILRIRSEQPITRATIYTLDLNRVVDMPVLNRDTEYQILVSELPTGVYILECDVEGAIVRKQIVVD